MKNFTVVIPEYNELSKDPRGFEEQLSYVSDLSKAYDVKLVDDSSTDGSWERIKEFVRTEGPEFQALRISPNGRKVGAIKKGAEESSEKYVVLTDYDSRIVNPEMIYETISNFDKNPRIAGIGLKISVDANSLWSKIQKFEYQVSEIVNSMYLNKQRKLRCISGAGGIWKREVLLELLKYHSGRHNGDDMETTAMAMRNGYEVIYDPRIEVKTKLPKSMKGIFDQRTRWALGALETFEKERDFYFDQIKNLKSRLGHVILMEWMGWATLPLAAFSLGLSLKDSNLQHLQNYLWYYLSDLGISSLIFGAGRKEIDQKKYFALLPLFPFFRTITRFPTYST